MQQETIGQQSTKLPPFNVPSEAAPVYAIAPRAGAFEVLLMLETKMAHLEALLKATYGGGGESFRTLCDDFQDRYMWACSDMATEIRELFKQLNAMRGA